MPIQVACKCGKQFQTRDENAGRRARCPECGNDLIVPTPGGGGDTIENPYLAPVTSPGPLPGQGTSTSGKAIASLVLGICSLMCNVVTGIPAVIFGCLSLSDVGRSHGALRGKGMAIAGIVMGGLGSTLFPVGVLVGLLLPAVNAAREAGRRVQCANNERTINLALINYSTSKNHFPRPAITDASGKPLLSWRVTILPYLDEMTLYNQFHHDEPWDSPHNMGLLKLMPKVYVCPSSTPGVPGMTNYRVFTGEATLFDPDRDVSPAGVKDGLSNTIAVVETIEGVPWTKPEDLPFDPTRPDPLPLYGAVSGHPGGLNAGFADGAVRFLPSDIKMETFRALITPSGGEVVVPSEL